MIQWILFSGIVIFIFFVLMNNSTDEEVEPDIIMEMKKNIQPYSGLNEELFIQYMNNLDIFGKNIEYPDLASKYLYKALNNAYDLQLYGEEFDFTDIIGQNARIGEEMILISSLKTGNLFIPKYLNK